MLQVVTIYLPVNSAGNGQQRQLFRAEEIEGSTKYGRADIAFNFNGMDLSENVISELSVIAQHSIAKKTWCTYKTAEKMLAMFCREKHIPLELPIKEYSVANQFHTFLMQPRSIQLISSRHFVVI
jgi:hypothetical protein